MEYSRSRVPGDKMSRDVSSYIEDAIEDKETYKIWVKAEIDPSRSYFSTLADDDPYDAEDYSVPTDTPVGQCMIYSPTRGGVVTFIVDPDTGAIYAMDQGSASKNDLSVTADKETKPSVCSEQNGSVYMWYCSTSGVLTRCVIAMVDFGVTGATNVGFNPPGWTIINGSPSCLDRERLVFVYQTSKGGQGVSYYNGTQWIHWGGRFISPNQVTDNGYWSIYTAAVVFGDDIYIYSTDIGTGEVRGVAYEPYQGLWSDLFIALPADLSRFCVTNAIFANGYIHIAGQFHRTEDLADAQVYSLIVRSKDGKTFSWDRFTMVSKLGYQFQIAINPGVNKLYASDRNSVGEASLSYFFMPFPADREVIAPPNDILEFSTDGVESATLRLKAHDEAYLDHAVVKRGSRCKVYLGYSTEEPGAEETIKYVHYMTYIIDGVETGHADGVRRMLLALVAEGVWKTSQIAFPFYSELISKSTLLDDCDERDNMYPATGGGNLDSQLIFDFWKHESWDGGDITTCTELDYHTGYGRGAAPKELEGAYTYGFRSCDLSELDFLSGYPKIDGTSVNVKLYGWGSVSDGARVNDSFTLYIVTIDEDGEETEHENDGLVSSYPRYPRYQTSSDLPGSYPIEYTFTGLTDGHFVKYVAVKQVATHSDSYSTTVPEKIEITNCTIQYINLETNCVWLQTKPSTYSEDDQTLLEVPAWGRPFVQFLTRPYTAFNFSVHATFVYEDGDDPVYSGTMGWGVVGMAQCGANYIAARFNLCSTAVELFSLRGNAETILASHSFVGESMPTSLLLEHSNGVLTVRHKSSTTWSQPIITYHWNEVIHGVISTSETGIMHVGVYGTLATEGFRHCSLNLNDADGLAALPQYADTLKGLPTGSTLIVLDDVVYTYFGKFLGQYKTEGNQTVGPYQGVQCLLDDGVPKAEIAYAPDMTSDETMFNNYLLAFDNGHTWSVLGTTFEMAYSQYSCEGATGRYMGVQNRGYVTWGLSELTPLLEDDIKFHPHGYWAFLWGTNRIWAKEVFATTLDHDATVKDMTQALCRAASVEAEYTGDWTKASESISTTPVEIAADNRHFPGGYDVRFRIPALGTDNWIALYADTLYIGDPDDTNGVDVGIKNVGGYLTIYALPKGGSEPASYMVTDIADSPRDIRILFHDLYASVYMGGKWIHTFAWNEYDKDADDHSGTIKWPNDPVGLYLYSNTNLTASNLLVSELFDWREAIYIESEMSAASALGSVMQERPIEIFPTSDGGLSFSYHIERDTVTYTVTLAKRMIRFHNRAEHTAQNAGSDAVVYFRDIAFANDPAFADSEGFITRVMKLSGLDTGARAAATLILEKANERQYRHRLEMRPDIRLEQGDRIDLTYTLVGTDTTLNYEMIVEDLSIRVAEGESAMEVVAREDILA